MKIAVISPFPVVPAHGGNRARTRAMMLALEAQGHEPVFVFMPSRHDGGADHQAHVEALGADRVRWLHRGGLADVAYYLRRAASKLGRRLGMGQGVYHGLDEIFYRPFLAQARTLQKRERFDAALVQYVSCSAIFAAFGPDVLKVLDTHDTFADRHLLDGGDGYSLTPSEEARGLRRADVVIAIQDQEAGAFRATLGDEDHRVVTISHLLDLSRRIEEPTPQASFVGSMFDANWASLRYFIDEVMLRVVAARPAFRLFVAGDIGRYVQPGPNIEVLGRVPHVADAFALGGVAVNPIVKGTGINIKMLDAFAAGAASVTTAFGARGLGEAVEATIVVPDGDPDAFAQAVLGLIDDAERRRALGRTARQVAEDWNSRQTAALAAVFPPTGVSPAGAQGEERSASE